MNKVIDIIVILGKSGSGKTTLLNNLVRYEHFRPLRTFTTRPKRSVNDNEYEFITQEDLKDIDLKSLIESRNYHIESLDTIWTYGTYIPDIEKFSDEKISNRFCCIGTIETLRMFFEYADRLIEEKNITCNVIPIMIDVPYYRRLKRIINRLINDNKGAEDSYVLDKITEVFDREKRDCEMEETIEDEDSGYNKTREYIRLCQVIYDQSSMTPIDLFNEVMAIYYMRKSNEKN